MCAPRGRARLQTAHIRMIALETWPMKTRFRNFLRSVHPAETQVSCITSDSASQVILSRLKSRLQGVDHITYNWLHDYYEREKSSISAPSKTFLTILKPEISSIREREISSIHEREKAFIYERAKPYLQNGLCCTFVPVIRKLTNTMRNSEFVGK